MDDQEGGAHAQQGHLHVPRHVGLGAHGHQDVEQKGVHREATVDGRVKLSHARTHAEGGGKRGT